MKRYKFKRVKAIFKYARILFLGNLKYFFKIKHFFKIKNNLMCVIAL